ncbi:MAG: hypothetical protein ABJC89_14105 [Acidobacteriota bacterium]
MNAMIRMSALALVLVTTAALNAQNTSAPAPAQAPLRLAPVPIKIQLVLARYQGDKKLSGVPYTLSVTANDGNGSAKVRMGVQMPIVSTVFGGGTGTPSSSYSYKDFGTNIDCSASSAEDGLQYKVLLTISDSSVYFQEQDPAKPSPQPQVPGVPAFRSFTSTFTTWLRDGQTSQYTSIPDQFSGQVLKIDATLTVLK